MDSFNSTITIEGAKPYLYELETLYQEMDRQFHTAASQYPFECNGCVDNCCFTLFYHHTVVEYLFLKSGFISLPPETRAEIKKRALGASPPQNEDPPSPKIMCPLNSHGLCILYQYRPMICRLHGIPNEIRRADGITLRGPGCEEFRKRHGENAYVPFDRTPLYLKMATIEKNLKSALHIESKFKKTVSRMILDFGEEGP